MFKFEKPKLIVLLILLYLNGGIAHAYYEGSGGGPDSQNQQQNQQQAQKQTQSILKAFDKVDWKDMSAASEKGSFASASFGGSDDSDSSDDAMFLSKYFDPEYSQVDDSDSSDVFGDDSDSSSDDLDSDSNPFG